MRLPMRRPVPARPAMVLLLLAAAFATMRLGAGASPLEQPAAQQAAAGPATVLLVFDSSYSMKHWLYDRSKLDIARDGVHEVLERLNRDTVVGLRALSHEEAPDPCTVTEMLVDFGAANSAEIRERVDEMRPIGTKTPLAYTLAQAREDLAGIAGDRRIVLISDGNDTCEGDPVAEAQQLGEMGVPLDIVGIGSMRRIPQYEEMAAANGLGSYSQARNGNQMDQALGDLFEPYSGGGEAPAGAGEMPGTPMVTEIVLEEEPDADRVATVGVDLEIILDVSNSMWGQIDGRAKIEIAREALGEALDVLDVDNVALGFRAYGHRVDRQQRDESCLDTELIEAFEPGNAGAIRSTAAGMQPKGQTPIALSLEKAGEDLAARPGYQHFVLLLSDGIESCDGDPEAAAARLREQGIDVVIHTVGFDVDAEAEDQLRGVSDATRGTYFRAGDSAALVAALRAIAEEVAEVAAMTEDLRERNPVMGGPEIAAAVPLVPGRYTLEEHLPRREYTHFRVSLRSGQLLELTAQVTSLIPTDTGQGIHASNVRVNVFDSEGNEVRSIRAAAIGQPGTRNTGRFVATEDIDLVLAVGADFNDLHRDSLFEVRVANLFDGDLGRDIPADGDQPLSPGQTHGWLGMEDEVDRYRLDGPLVAGTTWTFVTEPTDPDYRLEVILEDGEGRRLGRSSTRGGTNTLEVEFERDVSAAYLVLRDRGVGAEGQLSRYRLIVTAR